MKMQFGAATALPLIGGLVVLAVVSHPLSAQAAAVTGLSTDVLSPGSTQLTITGTDFGAADSSVDEVCFYETVNGVSRYSLCVATGSSDLVSWSNTQIVLNVPGDPDGSLQGGYLAVYADGNLASGAPLYHVQPVITGVDAEIAVMGMQVTITGQYFKDLFGSVVDYRFTITPYFNGMAGTVDYNSLTKTQVVATVPAGATTGPLTLDFMLQPAGPTLTAAGPTIAMVPPITDDPYSALQQYLYQVKVDQAWRIVGTGRAPIVAVIDDGVYINHPDLRNNIWINKKEKVGNNKDDDGNGYVDDIYGWNFLTNQGEMTVRGTHGTMVAGIIGAIQNNQVGITGINPRVNIMPLIVCNDQGCPFAPISKAITYAVDNGATVINLSLSSRATTGYSTSLSKAVKYAYEHGVIIVAAAGNGDLEAGIGQDLGIIPQSPVCNDISKNAVLGVGAVDSADQRTVWSNFGTCVDAYAPGLFITSTAVPQYSTLGDFYDIENGTSFASPIVAGVVSLLRQKYPYMPNAEVMKRVKAGVNANSVIDAYVVLSMPFSPPLISSLSATSIQASRLTGDRTLTITGKRFTKKTTATVGRSKATVKYVNSTTLQLTFSLTGLSYGNNLVMVTGSNKHSSIYRWLKVTE